MVLIYVYKYNTHTQTQSICRDVIKTSPKMSYPTCTALLGHEAKIK